MDYVEKAVISICSLDRDKEWEAEEALQELKALLETAGGEMVASLVQHRNSPDPRTYLGSGKVEEIKQVVSQTSADLVVFDSELTPSQQANLEDIIDVKVIDKTALILDIFTQRARSNEGKLQVELAQLEYRLPRLKGKGIELSRLGGGIGTRMGPGETKLEIDRRRIRKRIQHIKKDLKEVSQNRRTQRTKRDRQGIFNISLVGYTNAGKSSLLNTLTDADVLVEDKLFATLDSTSRKILLPSNQIAVLTDTVGFMQRLPHQLIAAFHSTLDEIRFAQLILHIIDFSQEHMERQINAVDNVLKELKVDPNLVTRVYNKIDKVNPELINRYKELEKEALFVSALKGQGLDELINYISENSTRDMVNVKIFIPFTQGNFVQEIYQSGQVLRAEHNDTGTKIEAAIPKKIASRLKKNGIRMSSID